LAAAKSKVRILDAPVSSDAKSDARRGLARGYRPGLSAKLLLLTILFVMIAEVLVFVPSVSNFRQTWIMERLAAAQIASLAAEAAPGAELPAALRDRLLEHAQVKAIAVKKEDARQLALQSEMPLQVDGHYDLRDPHWFQLIVDALKVYITPNDRVIRVVGQPAFDTGEFIEVVMVEAPLKAAMVRYGLNILALSIIISVITAALVYLALNALLVRPMTRLTAEMVRFRERPEDPTRIITPSARTDEVGTAERELAAMQRELADTLNQKSRLAALGLAVSKISHDLRNMLSSAQLLSDSLASVKNPTVQRFVPKLIASLDRAIRLCARTLDYGQAQEPAPQRECFPLAPLVRETGESLGLLPHDAIHFAIDIPEDLIVDADRDQLFRVLTNLCRNAAQALEADWTGPREINVSAAREGSVTVIEVTDTGPGVPAKAQERLFEAFQTVARKGGTGLGLAISAELIRAHGGQISLIGNLQGAAFRLTIPDRVLELAKSRRRRA
jgi:signal transduction histidine kinase